MGWYSQQSRTTQFAVRYRWIAWLGLAVVVYMCVAPQLGFAPATVEAFVLTSAVTAQVAYLFAFGQKSRGSSLSVELQKLQAAAECAFERALQMLTAPIADARSVIAHAVARRDERDRDSATRSHVGAYSVTLTPRIAASPRRAAFIPAA